MRIPGFTAEAAMPAGSYSMVAGGSATAVSGQVQPQACVNIGPCKVCVTTRLFPPRACLQFSCLGFNRSLCVP